MKTVRRLYFYAVAFITMEVVLWGIVGLLRSIIDAQQLVDRTQALAQALSLILVGVPIFLFHWLWAQRAAANDDEEKTDSLRAIFLYGALLATLLPVAQNLLALINRTLLSSAHLYVRDAFVGGSQTLSDNVIALAINLLIASYFWNVLRNAWPTLTDTENFSQVRRLYRFIWMLYGLLMVLYGSQQVLHVIFTLSTNVVGAVARGTVLNALALLLVGTPIWYYAWKILQDALADAADKESLLRLGILYLLGLSAVIIVLSSSGNLLYRLLERILGEPITINDFLNKIAGPISLALPFGVMWAYFGTWLRKQIDFDELETRRAGKNRLYSYILSFIGLTASFIGLVSLVNVVLDLITGDSYLNNGGFRQPLAAALATLAVSLPLWLIMWRPVQADALMDGDHGDHARRSVVRKVYLYLVLFAAVIGGMIAAVFLAFTLINAALGGQSNDFGNAIRTTTQVLLLFVLVLLYHLSALRKDGAARADALQARQQSFAVLVFDRTDGSLGAPFKVAAAKLAPMIPLTFVDASQDVPRDLKASAVVMPGSLALQPPENVRAWISSFRGDRLIVPDGTMGVHWMHSIEQTAESVRMLAEGEQVRLASQNKSTPGWMFIVYLFAALFAFQLLIGMLFMGIGLINGF